MAELVYGFPINYARFAAETYLSEQELRSMMSLYADRKELALLLQHDLCWRTTLASEP